VRSLPRSSLFPYTTLFRSGEWPAEVEALGVVAADLAETAERLPVLDALGDDSEPEVPAQVDRRLDDAGVALVRRHLHHERAVDRSEEHTSELQSLAYLVCR